MLFILNPNIAVIMKVMDPMRAMASLELMSTRGLETADQGPRMLSDSVSCHLSEKSYRGLLLQFGNKMVKLTKRRVDFVTDVAKLRNSLEPKYLRI